MKAFRPKWAPPEPSDGYTDEQRKALVDELERRLSRFAELWRVCPDRTCRRHRQCVGPDIACSRKPPVPPPTTQRQIRRLVRDFRRVPARI